MEIDLNDDAQEEEEGEGESNGGRSKTGDGDGMYMELWHACAGPHIFLPKRGSVVVYFPQGHLEQAQVASSASYRPPHSLEVSTYELPPQVFCRVVDVQLHAEKENDEVYARLTLFPVLEMNESNLEDKDKEDDGMDGAELLRRSTPHMFCKTLTASDTSTHGGFSVPRRAAEDCFPPLDYKQQRPSQELVAKDLHGVEWKFRHIYRGQPRRHLLTTGWSVFVNQKHLVAGDAVLFMRGANGELRLGIRRATRPHAGASCSLIGNLNMHLSVLSSAAQAISKKSMFYIFYNPRPSSAAFIIPYDKYIKSIDQPLSVGMRFKMRYAMEDAAERRFSGVISGVSDTDPIRWPNSKWRCLMVRWDEFIVTAHRERISPWEVESFVSVPALASSTGPRVKKVRTDMTIDAADNPLSAGGVGHIHFGESVGSSKVLQGQENINFGSPYGEGGGHILRGQDFDMLNPAYRSPGSYMVGRSIGFEESAGFQKVLQGQEFNLHKVWERGGLKMTQRPSPLFPYVLEDFGNSCLIKHTSAMPNSVPIIQSLASSYEMDAGRKLSSTQSLTTILKTNEQKNIQLENAWNVPYTTTNMYLKSPAQREENRGCKLFGFPLAEDSNVQNSSGSGKRSCTKVHKQGNPVGRAIDLSKLNGYDDLLMELERHFSMEGLLSNPDKGWQVVYTDSENDMMLVGDDPWHEFCNIVCKIHIYTQEEVEKMATGMNNDDAQSCLEEIPAVIDISKSSSPGPRDSSPTVTRTGFT